MNQFKLILFGICLVFVFSGCDKKAAQIDGLISDLAGGDFKSREAAHKELVEMGEDAIPALLTSINDKSAERKQRVNGIIREYLATVAKGNVEDAKDKFDSFIKQNDKSTVDFLHKIVSNPDDQDAKLKDQAAYALVRNGEEGVIRTILDVYLSNPEKHSALIGVMSQANAKNDVKDVLFDVKQAEPKRREAAFLLGGALSVEDFESLLESLNGTHKAKDLDDLGKIYVLERLEVEMRRMLRMNKNNPVGHFDNKINFVKKGLQSFIKSTPSKIILDKAKLIVELSED